MRKWSCGAYSECLDDHPPLTGTKLRSQSLPRASYHVLSPTNKVTSKRKEKGEPFAIQNYNHHLHFHHRPATSPLLLGISKTPRQTPIISRCVFNYNDRYQFSRLIAGSDLVFDAHFEGGNLLSATRKEVPTVGGGTSNSNASSSFAEYDLTLHHDVHSKGHTQWFYFSVSNVVKGMTVKFNIGQFTKRTSLFNQGLKPLMLSEKRGREWKRIGQYISYHPLSYSNCGNGHYEMESMKRNEKRNRFYVLTFTHTFDTTGDKCFFASSYPYTFSDLQGHLRQIQLQSNQNNFRRSLLCKTLGNNRCDLITITEPTSSLDALNKRLGVVITARVHPGETNASFICQGIIDFLIGDSVEAKKLRETFVFKIVPMLNPDGVINGNYRTALSGVDLNRRWDDPHPVYQPTIFHTKNMIQRFQKTRQILTVCDIHCHSRREGLFMYGNVPQRFMGLRSSQCIKDSVETPYYFPQLFHRNCEFFTIQGCNFMMQTSKASTMRMVMFQQLGIKHSYTLEASLSGCHGRHFSIHDLQQMGRDYCHTLLDFYNLLNSENKIMTQLMVVDSLSQNSSRSTNVKKNIQKVNSKAQNSSSRRNSLPHLVSDENGSDSNPSEDNLDYSEALKLLSNIPKKEKMKNQRMNRQKLKTGQGEQKRINTNVKRLKKKESSLRAPKNEIMAQQDKRIRKRREPLAVIRREPKESIEKQSVALKTFALYDRVS